MKEVPSDVRKELKSISSPQPKRPSSPSSLTTDRRERVEVVVGNIRRRGVWEKEAVSKELLCGKKLTLTLPLIYTYNNHCSTMV